MPIAPKSLCIRCWQYCVSWLRDACSEAPPRQTARNRNGLELALSALPLAVAYGAIYVLLYAVYGAALLAQHGFFWGLLVLCSAVATAIALWSWHASTQGDRPQRLRLCSDGTAAVFTGNGCRLQARVLPSSLRLGRHWLLVVDTADGRRHRLLLGPGNQNVAELAALGRWLRRPPAGPWLLR